MKERIKSIVLVLLVITNLILGSQVLSTKKLWSGDGYNFFLNMTNIPTSLIRSIKQHFGDNNTIKTRLELPELIIINTGYQTSRHLLNKVDKDFMPIIEVVNPFLSDAFSRPQDFVLVDTELFYDTLTAKSIYLKYPTDYDSSLFSYLLGTGVGDFSQSFSQLSDIVISSEGYVYVKDSLTENIYRIKTNILTDGLDSAIDEHISIEYTELPVINYAFDLGFDTSFATQKIVLSPMLPIYSEGFECKLVDVGQPLVSENGDFDEVAISTILPIFSMNPNGLRRYTEVDGTIVFVENNSILKVAVDGYVEYSAKDEGILLTSSVTPSLNEAIAAIADFVDNINKSAGSSSSLQLTSKLTAAELSSNTVTVTLDYIVNGSLVILPNSSSVTLTLTNGRITSYKHMIRNFKTTSETILLNDYIDALDNSISRFENQITDIEIDSLEVAYKYDGKQTTILPDWYVSVKEVVIND